MTTISRSNSYRTSGQHQVFNKIFFISFVIDDLLFQTYFKHSTGTKIKCVSYSRLDPWLGIFLDLWHREESYFIRYWYCGIVK